MSTLTPRGRAKRQLPLAPGAVRPDQSPSAKSVTFNKQTIETSVGGTQSIGRIKRDILSTSSSTCSSVSVSLTLSDMTQSTSDSASSNENTLSLTNVSRLSDDSEQDENLTNRRPLDTLGVVASSSFLDTPLKRSPAWKENEYNKENFSSPVKELRRNTFESRTELCSPSSMRTPTRRYTLDDKLVTTPECYSHVQMADMDLPRFEMSYDRDLHSPSDEDSKSSVTVAVRVRPFTQREKVSENCGRSVVSMRGNETEVTSFTGQVYRFAYDFSFWSFNEKSSHFSSQEHVYKMLAQPLLVKAFEGYNTCLFAYGQTGSGKSYSIMGQGNEAGIIPRFCQDLFSRAEQEVTRDSEMVKINVEISFFEIYNEKIHDLLATSKDKGIKKSTLKVREDPNLGPFVDGLDKYVVNSFRDVEKWIEIGNSNRATAATAMNDKSSRSHSVFTLVLTQTKTEEIEGTTHDSAITSKINLVDLAGSERQSQAQTTGQRQKEGAFINKSLLTLGIVISELAEQKKGFIPYRNSVLTRLLKESLGGNSKTAMIATISPSHHHIEETLSTLRYARQASRIVNTARVNEDQKTRIIKKLRSEIEQLRKQTGPVEQSACLMEIQLLKEQLQEKEKECQEVTRSWQEKLKRSEERKAIEAKQLEKAGIAFKVDNKLPNLVNLNEDPILSEMLLYVIKEGITRVGRMCPESAHEIQLNGALIAENHCMINNEDTVVSITPIDDAPTYVNGELVSDSVILHHGDRVNLGGDHYFRFNHPMEVSTKAGGSIQQEIKDFEFAKQELYRAQEKRLLDEAKKQAQEEVKKAEQEWISQKIDYEDKLAELEKELRQQNEKGQKAEQSRQEAQEYIQKLQKQKTLLELEVKAGKNRQQLEIKAAQKVASQPAPAKTSPLLELLESERQKAATRLEELKQKRSDMFTVPKKHAASDLHCARADLYKVELLVREANKISQFLKKSTVFSRQDYLEEESMNTMIKVLNTKLGVCTYWTVPKFEEKLIHMRDMYQNDGDSSADDEIFNDPSDNWEEDSSTTSPTKSPKSRLLRKASSSSPPIKLSASFNGSIRGSVSSMMTECMCTHQPQQSAIFRQYKTFALGIVDKFQGLYFEESVADKIAHSCNSIKQSVLSICDLMNNLHNNSISESSPSEDSLTILGQDLVSSLNNLTSNCAVWYSVCLREQRQSTIIDDLTHKLKDQARLMGNQIVLFLQGCENEIDSLLRESSTKIIDCVHSICKLTGELALATDTRMVSLELLRMEEQSANHLSPDVCQSFLCGSDLLVEKSLQGALGNLEELESRAKKICQDSAQNTDVGEIPRTIEVVVSATKDLLAKCQDIQVEVDTSMRESFDMIPPQYYSLSYRRSRGLMTQISNMQNDVNCLVQTVKPVSEGKDGDIRKVCYYAELIQNGATKLISTTNDRPRQSECPEISVLSDAQAEELETSARILCSATKTLINSAGKISNVTTQVLTPRSKRALPISPDKTLRTSVQRNLPLKNGIGKRDGLAKGVLSNQPSVLKSQS